MLASLWHAFFWDTIQLGSMHGHWFYENGLGNILLPNDMDSGHPPVFGMYLAACWMLFGKTLPVSHLAMAPFVAGILWQLHLLTKRLYGKEMAPWAFLLVAALPTLMAQSILMSPDVAVVFFFLSIVNLSFKKQENTQLKPWETAFYVLSICGLSLMSMRGMMLVATLFLWEIWMGRDYRFNHILKKTLPYLPAGLLAVGFMAYHYFSKGWLGYHEDSPWAGCFQKVDAKGFVKNIFVLGWRLLDFGQVATWGILIGGSMALFWKKTLWKTLKGDTALFKLFSLALCVSLISIPMLFYQSLLGHRYLLPIYIAITLLTAKMLEIMLPSGRPKLALLCGAWVLCLLGGNFWKYPTGISMGWDSTLGHWPFYELKSNAVQRLKYDQIPLSTVGTAFPAYGSGELLELNGDTSGMVQFDLDKNAYVLYSNYFNDFSNADLERLNSAEWEKEWETHIHGGTMVLYKKL